MNFTATLKAINESRLEEAERIREQAARIDRWAKDVENAVVICSHDCDPSVHFAAKAISDAPLQLEDNEIAVLAGALFKAIYRDQSRREENSDVLAGLSDTVDSMLGRVVRQREEAL